MPRADNAEIVSCMLPWNAIFRFYVRLHCRIESISLSCQTWIPERVNLFLSGISQWHCGDSAIQWATVCVPPSGEVQIFFRLLILEVRLCITGVNAGSEHVLARSAFCNWIVHRSGKFSLKILGSQRIEICCQQFPLRLFCLGHMVGTFTTEWYQWCTMASKQINVNCSQ